MAKSRRTKACEIPRHVKADVYARDNEKCVLCGRWVRMTFANAHFIPRSHGGLGVVENIITLCNDCHHRFDNTGERQALKERLRSYLKSMHDDWQELNLYFTKE